MPATLSLATLDVSPGNVVTLTGTGFGTSGSLVLANQGIPPADLVLPYTAWADAAITFQVPDGATTAPLTVTAQDGSFVAVSLVVASQYCQASQYSAELEGTTDNVAALNAGALDNALRDASAIIDGLVGDTGLRLLQLQEDHTFKPGRNGRGPRVRPNRGRRGVPLISIDAFSLYVNGRLSVTFTTSGLYPQVYFNAAGGYAEVQSFGLGNAVFSPSSVSSLDYLVREIRIVYTSGYGWMQTPRALRKAAAIIATELFVNAGIIKSDLGGLARVRKGDVQYDRRSEAFDIPAPVKLLLKPWLGTAW